MGAHPPHPPSPPALRELLDPRGHVDALLRAALDAADPAVALQQRWPAELYAKRCRVLAVGKAASRMLAGVIQHQLCQVESALVIKPPGAWELPHVGATIPIETHEADHPLPTGRNVAAAQHAAEFVTDARRASVAGADLPFLVLLSGGASALLTLPREGVTLDDCRSLTEALMKAGAPIAELNCVRKHLEVLKGGGIAGLAAPMPVWTLILSDVIGDDVATIGSGPTCADPTTFAEALAIVNKRGAASAAPAATRFLQEGSAGRRPETLKPRDPILARAHHRIIANNETALAAVASRARDLGFGFVQTTARVEGEARVVGRRLANQALHLQLPTRQHPACVIIGGETTVTVQGEGLGGRNQELALAAAIEINGKGDIVVAAFSTDGIDGPTDAAGAVASSRSVIDASARGVDAAAALERNDSYRFFEAAGGLIRTGPTGTNVNDISVALVY